MSEAPNRSVGSGTTYEVLRRLGKGGMAEVFLARQTGIAGLKRLVVVKRLLPQYSDVDDVEGMLLDEARVAAQLTHPNIVQIFELGKDGDQYFIAMEFVDGCDLATLARIERHRQSRVPLRLTLRVVAEAAMGLDYAHRQLSLEDGRPLNIVHRDVSPHNIMCSREGGVKVTDFGISKFVGKHQLTQVGVVKGKVQYMAPEQYRGEPVDHRSDIYSLGVVLYQLTVGKLPRVNARGEVAMKSIVDGIIPRPSDLRPDFPEELETIVMRALAHEPDDRYPDAASLRDDLLDFSREQDLLAFPKELAEYVNEQVPPSPLVVREKSVIALSPSTAPPSAGPIEPGASRIVDAEDPEPAEDPGTEALSKPGANARSLPATEPGTDVTGPLLGQRLAEQLSDPGGDDSLGTAIPIDTGMVEGSEPAVLAEESLTPMPSDRIEAGSGFIPPAVQSTEPLTARPLRPVLDEEDGDPDEGLYDPTVQEDPPSPVDMRRPAGPIPPAAQPTARIAVAPVEVQRPAEPSSGGNKVPTAVWAAVVAALLAGVGSLVYVVTRDPAPVRTTSPDDSPAAKVVGRAAGAGVIHLVSRPDNASVAVDGSQRCPSTPCQIAGLPLGREFEVTLRSPGHTPWSQRVVLTANEPKLLLRADLTPLAGGSATPAVGKPDQEGGGTGPADKEQRPTADETKESPASGSPAAKPAAVAGKKPVASGGKKAAGKKAAGKKAAGKKAAGKKAAGRGGPKKMVYSDGPADKSVLVVDVRPWAEVWLDGQRLGHTPIQRVLKPGLHKLELKNPDLKYSKTISFPAKLGKKAKFVDMVQPPGG